MSESDHVVATIAVDALHVEDEVAEHLGMISKRKAARRL